MDSGLRRAFRWVLLASLLAGSTSAEAPEPALAPVEAPSAVDLSPPEPGLEWPGNGRDWREQRHSPIEKIHRRNVSDLGLAWSHETGTTRGMEATPIVVDGVMYVSTAWSRVLALNAKTGELLWKFDPQVPGWKARDACCDVVNRGVAVWKGRVYVGTLDGRLMAIDAKTGTPVWSVLTVDPKKPYTITGAPRVVKGRIVIGNGGADFGVRGYVSAYDADDGSLAWRFYTVPASKEGPHEGPAVELAASTWSADSLWESGLGGTVWDSMVWDPELDLLYVGVGNSSVYHRETRSPGGGDNLFLASIVALNPDTGARVWHYQTTPGEAWDYTATQPMILAELEIKGRLRKVLLQAPKNGFFYVLDRETGELLSAEKYVFVSWASHVDLQTGRPVERPEADWTEKTAAVAPAVVGGHSWHPMSFSARTGWVYIPTVELTYLYDPDPDYRFKAGKFNTGEAIAKMAASVEGYEEANLLPCSPSRLVAWDPIAAERRWSVPFKSAIPAGVLSTGGGLVFYGGGGGRFQAFDDRTGVRLWASPPGTGIMAAPISYQIDGEQYVAVVAGVGGSLGGHFARLENQNEGQVLAWKLGGKAKWPVPQPRVPAVVNAPKLSVGKEVVEKGQALYHEYCHVCHGVGAVASGLYPDLRHASAETHDHWKDIVLGGIRAAKGMASFADALRPEDADAIHAYVSHRALSEPNVPQRVVSWAVQNVCVPASWLAD